MATGRPGKQRIPAQMTTMLLAAGCMLAMSGCISYKTVAIDKAPAGKPALNNATLKLGEVKWKRVWLAQQVLSGSAASALKTSLLNSNAGAEPGKDALIVNLEITQTGEPKKSGLYFASMCWMFLTAGIIPANEELTGHHEIRFRITDKYGKTVHTGMTRCVSLREDHWFSLLLPFGLIPAWCSSDWNARVLLLYDSVPNNQLRAVTAAAIEQLNSAEIQRACSRVAGPQAEQD